MFHQLKEKIMRPQAVWLVAFLLVFGLAPNLALAGVLDVITGVLLSVVTTVFGLLVGLAGLLLNYSVNEYVVGFGKTFTNDGVGVAVEALWTIMRDIFNLSFIFGLVYIGLKMIFNSEDTSAKKMLGSLIIAALLVNFSLFISKTVVEASNLVAGQVISGFTKTGDNYNISESFAEKMGMRSSFKYNVEVAENQTGGGKISYVFGLLIMYCVATFVFFAGGILLIIRFVSLNLYMIFSPLMFAGFVFPAFQSVTSSYWKGFLGKAFFAPAYLLMLYFSYRILESFSSTGSAFSDLFTGNAGQAGAMAVLMPFIITCILLVYSIIFAQKMGATGAGAVISAGQTLKNKGVGWAKKGAGGATAGAVAVATRNSAGRAAYHLANNQNLQKKAATSWVARQSLKASRKVAGTSFDARKIGGLGNYIGIGEGAKGGFTAKVKQDQKEQEEFMKSLGETDLPKNPQEKEIIIQAKIAEQSQIPGSDIAEQQDIIARAKADKESKEATKEAADLALANKKKEIADQKRQLEKEIKSNQDIEADPNANHAKKAAARASIQSREAAIRDIDLREAAAVKNLTEAVNETTRAFNQARNTLKSEEAEVKNIAEASIKYANQIAYAESVAKSGQFWNSKVGATIGGSGGAVAGGAAGAGLAVGALLPALAVATLGAVSGTMSYGYVQTETAKHLRKKLGKGGTGLAKEKKDKDLAYNLANAQKELIPDTPKPAEAPKVNNA